MKKLLQFLMTMFLSVAMVGCYSTEEPVGPDVPVVGSLKLSQEEMTVGAEGGEFSVDIFTEYAYETSTNVDWITISGGSCGTEYCTLYFTVAKNDTTSEREGVITVFCDDFNLSATLTVTQEAGSQIPNNEIWYTSSDGAIVTPYATDVFGANIVSNTYENGQGVIIFDNEITQIGTRAFQNCTSLTSVTIPNNVTSIGNYAFGDCELLTAITIPDSVVSIGTNPFVSCSSLSTFYGKFASEDNRCLIVDGVLTSFASAGVAEYSIPASITAIGAYAFYYCTSLTSITIPNSVTSIGDRAFYNCKSLTDITIPDSVISIGNYAFSGCTSLTDITIPDSVTSIGYYAFSGCSSLTNIYCKPTTPPTAVANSSNYWRAFNSNASGRKIYVPSVSVGVYRAAQYWSDYADVIFSEDGDDSTTTDSVAVPEDKYPSKTNFKRRIMITQFTGTGCGYCPRIINALYQLNSSSYADDVVLSAAHLYNSSDPAYLSSAKALSSSLGITGYPTVCVDMDKSATTGSSYAAIVSLINSANSRVSVKGGIAVNSKYNAETGSISINALVKAKESAEFRIGAWLLEDGVYGQQSNYGITPVDGVDLNTHNNCVRTAYSNQTSSDFTGFSLGTIEAGKTASKEFTFALKPNGTGAQDKWNHDNLRLIVFIATKEGSNWLVNNVVKVPKDGSVDFEYTE